MGAGVGFVRNMSCWWHASLFSRWATYWGKQQEVGWPWTIIQPSLLVHLAMPKPGRSAPSALSWLTGAAPDNSVVQKHVSRSQSQPSKAKCKLHSPHLLLLVNEDEEDLYISHSTGCYSAWCSAPFGLLCEVSRERKCPLLCALLHKTWSPPWGRCRSLLNTFLFYWWWLHMWQTLQLFPVVKPWEEPGAVST